MPMVEHMPITVTLTVEVDGHTLTFDAAGTTRGPRYHGRDPKPYAEESSLEHSIRTAAAIAMGQATVDAARALARLYPLHTDGRST